MANKLLCGHYLGRTLSNRRLSGIVLTETLHPSDCRIPPHAHENSYFCFVRAGTYTETYGSKTRCCKPYCVAFHPAGERHSERVDDVPVHSLNIELETAFISRIWDAAPIDGPADFEHGRTSQLGMRIYQELQLRDTCSNLVIEGLVLELVGETSRSTGFQKGPPRRIRQAREIIHDRFREKLTLSGVAELVDMHPVYLANTFRRWCGCSLGEYVRRVRIDYACDQLKNTRWGLTTIALEAGFCDQSHFSRTFRRYVGLTPSQYRRGPA